jgi:hypothetical protein
MLIVMRVPGPVDVAASASMATIVAHISLMNIFFIWLLLLPLFYLIH